MKNQRLLIIMTVSLGLVIVLGVLGIGLNRSGQAEEAPLPTPILQYPDAPPTPTTPPKPTDAPQTAATTLFQDDFASDASLDSWTFLDLENVLPAYRSVWVIEAGTLNQERTAAAGNPNFQETLAVIGPTSWTDYTVTAKVSDQENVTFGLVARRQGDSFYRYRILEQESGAKQVLEKVVDGSVTPLVEVEGAGYERRRWYTMSLQVQGNTIQAVLDGEVVAEATDAMLAQGQAGLFTLALGGVSFDDVTVTTP